MAKEKRNPHTYKCTDKVYREAMKRAKKEKKTLSKLIEDFVIDYGKTLIK